MAKLSAHGTEMARYSLQGTGIRFRVMSDGAVLRQIEIFGKWEAPTVFLKSGGETALIAKFQRDALRREYS